jgi:predicted nucleic acid-binding protein
MKCRVFIDTNVFIYAFEYPNSNSVAILDLLNKEEIEVVISEQVIKEVIRYFKKFHSLQLARTFRRYLLQSCIVVQKQTVLSMMDKYKEQIKEKDLEQLAAVKQLGIKYLIAYDRDFDKFEEYITPKKFLQKLKMKEKETQY